MADLIEIPDFDFSAFYYPDFIRSLTIYKRQNVPEITDESDEEPFTQLIRAFALVGHLNNVLLDVAATETLLPTARLLESVRSHLKLIDVTLDQATPATADVIFELSTIFTTITNFIPQRTQVATQATDTVPQIIFEANTDNSIDPTNVAGAVFNSNPAIIEFIDNTFNGGDTWTIQGVDFEIGVNFTAGADLEETAFNLTVAVNASTNAAIENEIFAYNVGAKVVLTPLNLELTTITVTESDGATDNATIRSGGFSLNYAGQSEIDGSTFLAFDQDPEPGSILYIMHSSVMWDALNFTLDTNSLGITGVWEYYDGNLEDTIPDSVTNLGSTLEFDVTDLMGQLDRSGALVTVTYSGTGASETRPVIFESSTNKIITTGLLGQVAVSTDRNQYIVGTDWNEVPNINDQSQDLTQDGSVGYDLPQDQTRNWTKRSINAFEGFALRYRVISVVTPTNPEIDLIDFTFGNHYAIFSVTQGESKTEDPLASSDGSASQEFTLSFAPLIDGSLTFEVDEGSGFSSWNRQENFLTSTQISKDYVLEITAADVATITTGDGVNGKKPVAGVDNIRASYRVFSGGTANDGNVGSSTINVNKSGIAFVRRVFNPRSAFGFTVKEGSTDEDLARVKIAGPASLRVRNRAITPEDYEFLATEYTTSTGSSLVARALAIEEVYGVKTLELVVVGTAGALLTNDQLSDISVYFNGDKSQNIDGVGLTNHEATAVNYTPRIIDVVATVQGGNQTQIENALLSLLNPTAKFEDNVTDRWDFGSVVPAAIISAEIINVDRTNIKNVALTSPSTDIQLGEKELPLAGTITITII